MPTGQNKVILEVLVRAKAETAAMGKAKGAMKGLGNATKKTGKEVDRFRIATAGAQRQVGRMRNILLLLKFAMAMIGFRMLTRQLGSYIKAWAAQEQAVNRLNVALAGVGRYTKQVSEDYQKMAADMQKASVFGDEAIMEVMQTLMTLGNVADKDMRRATQAVLDFSSATGRDLAMATLLVSKAAVGYTGELSRYGIMIDKSLSKTEKFAATLEFLAKMKDRAKAETYTLSGAVKQLGNSYGDAKEKVGEYIAEQTNLMVGIKVINEFVIALAKNTGMLGKINLSTADAFLTTMEVLYKVKTGLQGVARVTILLGNAMSYLITMQRIQWVIQKRTIWTWKKSEQEIKVLLGTFKEQNKVMAESLSALIDLGDEQNNFIAFCEKIRKLIPGMTKEIDEQVASFEKLGAIMGVMGAVKAWDTTLKSAEKYYKSTYSEEQKKKKQEIDTIKTTLKANLDAIKKTHKAHLEKIGMKDYKLQLKKAEEYSNIEKQLDKERIETGKKMDKQFAKDKEANWIKGMRSIKSYHKLSRSEEIAIRQKEINIWADTQWEKTKISKDATKEEIAYQMKQRKELIDKLKKTRAEVSLQFPETFGQAVESGLDKLVISYGNTYDRIANMTQDLAKTMQSTMSEVFFDAFTGELKTTAEYYQAFAKTMLKTTMDYVTKEIMAMAIGKRAEEGLERESAIKKMAIKAWEFAGKQKLRVLNLAAESAAAIKSVAISAWEAIRKVAMAVWQFVAKTWSAYASIPYVGAASAIAVTAAGLAAIAAYRPMAKGGIVTSETRATIGEAGPEAVVPLKRGPGGKLGIATYGGRAGSEGGGTIVENHYYINAVDSKSFADIVESNPAIISEVINRNIKRNGTNRDVMRAYT